VILVRMARGGTITYIIMKVYFLFSFLFFSPPPPFLLPPFLAVVVFLPPFSAFSFLLPPLLFFGPASSPFASVPSVRFFHSLIVFPHEEAVEEAERRGKGRPGKKGPVQGPGGQILK